MNEDRYTSFAFDEHIDLKKIPYWIYNAINTPPGQPRTPMFDWIYMNGNNWAVRYALDKLSIPTVKSIAFRSYHGYQMLTVILPDTDKEISQRTEKYKIAIRDLIDNFDQRWNEDKTKLIEYAKKPKGFNFDTATFAELSEIFQERINAEISMYQTIQYIREGLGTVYAHFENTCKNMLGIDRSNPVFHKLFGGFENDSYQADKELHLLAVKARELGLKNDILANKPEDVISTIRKTESGKKWLKELKEYLSIHGWRCLIEMEYISPSWVEQPEVALSYIQKYLMAESSFALDEILSKQAAERETTEENLLGRIPLDQRRWFKTLLNIAQKYAVWNLEHGYYCQLYQYAITRHVLIEIGKRLTQQECLELSEDTLFLIPEELGKALSSPETCDLKEVVIKRRDLWEKNKHIIPPPLIARISPEEAGALMLQSKDPVAASLLIGKLPSVSVSTKADLIGKVCSPGVAEGPARVILSPDQLNEVQKGEILVAPSIWHSWSPVFSLVKGIVTDKGGTFSYGGGIGREYGIPVLSNVIEGTKKIKTGQIIAIDTETGSVNIIDSLHGKKILVVDDEPDINETLEELLPMCEVAKATTFDEAKKLMENNDYDIAILDIMGVKGYELLKIANKHNIPAAMFTAQALTLEDTVKSYKEGAAYYIPKAEIANIGKFLNDILEGIAHGKRFWNRWFDRFGTFYEKKFGAGWQNRYPEFWEIFKNGEIVDNDEK